MAKNSTGTTKATESKAAASNQADLTDRQFIAGLGSQFAKVSSRLAEVGLSNNDLEPGGAASFETLSLMGARIEAEIIEGAEGASDQTLALLRGELEQLTIQPMLDSAAGMTEIAARQANQTGSERLSFWGIIKCVAEALKCIAEALPFIGDRFIKIFCCLIDLICCLSGRTLAP